jgi:hypothetical protein
MKALNELRGTIIPATIGRARRSGARVARPPA